MPAMAARTENVRAFFRRDGRPGQEAKGFRLALPAILVLLSALATAFSAFVAFLWVTVETGPKDTFEPANFDRSWFLPTGLAVAGIVLALIVLRRGPNVIAIGSAVVGGAILVFLLALAPFW